MIQTRLFKNTFVLLFIVAVLNFFAEYLYLYWTIWWLDMLVHFFAGMCVAMAAILLYYFKNKQFNPPVKVAILVAIISAFTIGFLWEIYELYFGMTSFADGLDYYLDTVSDLIMDVSGGIIGALYAHRLLK